jgi:hypothetical protein
MPNYEFESETGSTELIFFSFAEAPSIGSFIEYEGKRFKRIPSLPQASSDTVNIDPFSKNDYVKATNKTGGTIGDLWQTAKEFSDKREQIAGTDPIKEAHLNEQQKKTGRVPLERKRMEAKKKLEAKGITIE